MTRGRRDRLGRGLGALLGDLAAARSPEGGEVRHVPVGGIAPSPYQPRREMSETELEALAQSIRENGLLQPVVVRPVGEAGSGMWQLVAGERRWRAVRRLGWQEIPAVVREVDDRTMLVLALVENLQREALSPLEEADGYRALADDFGLNQSAIAQLVGRDRSTVANTLRLLKLPPSVRRLLAEGRLTPGHARALLAVDDPRRAGELARAAVRGDWSVREMEARVRRLGAKPKKNRNSSAPNPVLRALEEELREALGTRVSIARDAAGRGRIEIPFYGDADLERLFALLTGTEASQVLG
ncbi:MAG: ParB/RepB/Spo0J family partition protein [Gemmatimonadetes bacterium]|nr:ParB/RepB/Spo0J family partition protein [Gemmatimonadota bacterium]